MAKDQEKRIWPKVIVALGLFLALFAGGLTAGLLWTQGDQDFKEIGMSVDQCERLASQIINIAQVAPFESGLTDREVATIIEMQNVFAKNCAGRTVAVEKAKPVKPAQPEQKPTTTCESIEYILKGRIYPNTEFSDDPREHVHRAGIYEDLIKHGCAENEAKYRELLAREHDIMRALGNEMAESGTEIVPACKSVESVLKRNLYSNEDSTDSRDHIRNAGIYASLASRGCPENAEKYRELALREIEIARALTDDKFYDNGEIIDVIETYKKLDMKAAAEQVFEKAKKLTDPAIDFILQVEKIINE
jgi:hypothetical protein